MCDLPNGMDDMVYLHPNHNMNNSHLFEEILPTALYTGSSGHFQICPFSPEPLHIWQEHQDQHHTWRL